MFIFEKAPFPECHASTIVETSPGRLMAAWFGGTREKAKDVQIWASRFSNGKWSELEVVGTENGYPCWNPVLFMGSKGDVILWYKAGPDPQTWSGYVRRSKDEGKTWSKAEIMPAGQFGPVRAKPIRIADGTEHGMILAGTSVESHRTWAPYVDRSPDDGHTWFRSNAYNVTGRPRGMIQPTIFQADDKRIIAMCRSADTGRICVAESRDLGQTFSPARITDLPNPSSGIDAVKTREKDVFLIYNPTPVGRSPISLARSTDDGTTWTKVVDLETEPGEFSYPAMIQSADGKLQITYTWKRKHIKYLAVDPAQYRQ